MNPGNERPTLRRIINQGRDLFRAKGVDGPALSARILAGFALGLDQAGLVLDRDRVLSPEETELIGSLFARRAKGEPVAYITGEKEFYGLSFKVTPHTLIPRPETEHIVEQVLAEFPSDATIRFADLGTGSGALAATLAKLFPRSQGIALDLSFPALETARENALAHGAADRLLFVRADFAAPLFAPRSLDLIVANPPYVGLDEYGEISPEVRDFEPRTALVPGPAGLEAYPAIIREAGRSLKPGGLLLLEIGFSQAAEVILLFRSDSSSWSDPVIICDLAGLDRVVSAKITA